MIGMKSRNAHTRSLLRDGDVLQVMGVSVLACIGTAGLLYAYYLGVVWRTAARAPAQVQAGRRLVVFGKHAPRGEADPEFNLRLDRAASVWATGRPRDVLLLGGGPAGLPTEAEIAYRGLLARGVPEDAGFHLEQHSRDTLQNLRNARDLMRLQGFNAPVALLSNRYHLARCLQLARQLGFEAEPCAAEEGFRPSFANLRKMAAEAAYVCLADVGTRWARLTRSKKMLARVT